jgi:hypothetical protein
MPERIMPPRYHFSPVAALPGSPVHVAGIDRPRGVLAVWCYGACTLDDFYSNVVGPYWPAERIHVESGYRTLPFPKPELTPVWGDPLERQTIQWPLSIRAAVKNTA